MLSKNLSGHMTEDTSPNSLASDAVIVFPNKSISLKRVRLFAGNTWEAKPSGIWPSFAYVFNENVALSLANIMSQYDSSVTPRPCASPLTAATNILG